MSELHEASPRVAALAERFQQTNSDALAAVESWSDADWHTICPAEEWPVAVVAHHIAVAHAWIVEAMRAVATGQSLPLAFTEWEIMHADNAHHAEQYAACSREETLDLLRANGAAAERFVRALSDEELERAAPSPLDGNAVLSVRQWVEDALIFHVHDHLSSIQAAIRA